jgi:hypothetical protein
VAELCPDALPDSLFVFFFRNDTIVWESSESSARIFDDALFEGVINWEPRLEILGSWSLAFLVSE